MDIVLENGEIICIDGDARNLNISCRSGRLWVTQAGDPNDHLISPGESFIITRKGKIAVTAIDHARLRLAEPIKLKQSCLPWQVVTV